MSIHSPKPVKSLLVASALAFAGLACQAGFTPIPLDTNSFNHDVVIEATAPGPLNATINATMDGGTNKNGNTWYERGYNPAAPTTGLAPAGSTLVDATTTHTYVMPPDYHVNNAVMVGHQNGARTPVFPKQTLTFTTPTAFAGLSFLTASGNGPVLVGYVINYADSNTESNTFSSLDWFNAATRVMNAAGRVSIDGGGIQNVNGNPAGALFAADVTANPTVNITSIDFYFAGAGANNNTNNNGRAAIFAVSGSSDGLTFNTPIAVTGFAYDIVMEADGPPTLGTGLPAGVILTNSTYISLTMDGGLSKLNNCWYEKGYYATFPGTGIPAAGSTFNSATLPATYTMPPTYATNCAAVLCSNVTTANIVFSGPPSTYAALSFLCAAANGDTFVPCVISFQDGSTETNTIFVPDWFNRELPWAYLSFGRVNPRGRGVNNTPDIFVSPFVNPYPGPGAFDFRGLGLPTCRLFDAVVNLTNTAGVVTNVALSFTNGASTRVASIFAVSGAPAASVPPVFGYRGTPRPGQPANAQVNAVRLVKAWEGTNNIVLSVTNIAGTAPITYQWKKAPRGGGLHDILYSIDYETFANVADGGRVSGATTSALVISNATLADSADYLVVASNGGGSVTSLVATVMVLTTNQSLLIGGPLGDVIANYTGDGAPVAESIDHASDRVLQKWLSYSLNNNTLPFVGPVGYTVTPVSGASIVSSMRFIAANDASGRDPFDYTLEGSSDGATWTRITGGALTGTLSLPTGRNGTGSTPVDALAQQCVEVDFANATGYKSYRVTITNNFNRTGDALMQIGEIELLGTLVPNPPVWVNQPNANVTVFVGTSPTFSAQASGYPLPKYQWYKNGSTLIVGATNSTYTLPNAQLSDSGTTFSCVANNTFGSITSSSATLTVVAVPGQTYPSAILVDNPLGYWRLNEADNSSGNNGVVARDSAGGHNGYYSNSVNNLPGYNPTADPDTAASFGTYLGNPYVYSNSYVAEIRDLSFARATNAGPAAFSVEAWVLSGTPNGNQAPGAAIVSKGYNGILNVGTGTGTEQFALDVGTGSFPTFRFLVRDAVGNGHLAQSTVLPYDTNSFAGVWRHLVGVCDQAAGKVYLYVDGILAASGDIGVTDGILAQPLPMTIGARKSGGATDFDNQWVGTIDDVSVYGTALSAGQVLSHFYAAQRPPIFSLQPTNQTTSENVSVTFASAAYGAGTVSYQWYLSDGFNPTAAIGGQTSSNLTFVTTAAQSGNLYQVVAKNAYGSITSAVAQLTVVSGAPSFATPGIDLPFSDTFYLGHVIQLRVVALGTAPFTYQWQKNNVNIVDDYRTFGSQTDNLTIGYAVAGDSGTYKCIVTGVGSTSSSEDVLSVTAVPAKLFNAAGTGWSLQGTTAPIMGDNTLELTSALGSTARTAFMATKQGVSAFSMSFVYQTVSGAGGADGVTLCFQNAASGPTAQGGAGGGLGYSGIAPSVALALNIYDPNTRGIRLLQDGVLPAAAAGAFAPIAPVLVGGNANPIQVDVGYTGGILTVAFKDTVTSAAYTTNFTVDIPAIVGSASAYMGFTGADGGVSSRQVVSNFVFTPPKVAIKVQQVGGSLVLSWPASTGAYLQSTPTLGTPVWTSATDLFRVVGNEARVVVTPLTGDRYFRLQVFP